mgnify:FL=1
MSALDVPANELIVRVAAALKDGCKDSIIPPVRVNIVKSGSDKERPPTEPDFWYKRCASVLYNSYKHGTIGVRRLRRKYGGRTQHIVSRSHHRKAGGKIIRLAMQQLEKAGLMKLEKLKVQKDPAKIGYAGRVITSKGKSLVDKTAGQMKS